jgi:GH24 family phage-related lysozyme (muramidase)
MARIARRTTTPASTPAQISIAGSDPPAAIRDDARMLCAELMRWETCCQHLYVDADGHVATGLGHRLPSVDAALLLAWRHRGTGQAATRSEVRAAFEQIRAQGPGHRSIAYRFASDLVLAAGVAADLAAARIERELLPGLRRLFRGFDRYPLPARRALVDMAYDLGLRALGKFRNLVAACERGDFATAAEQCHRRTTRQIRNTATRMSFQQAADLTASVCAARAR